VDLDGNIARKNSKGKFELKTDPGKAQPLDDRPCEAQMESELYPHNVSSKNGELINRPSSLVNRNTIFKSIPVLILSLLKILDPKESLIKIWDLRKINSQFF
jgi:hypothetical protein